ncbi:glycosyltransferase family 2 protein [Haloterrigena salifodinae]|uniref:Glycosyltransferase family 2 protein n=1 Tax=Haloterrigena salifodinae TaxID=2675099 RepID=A0A8T8E2W1_9EURY|nr:glycosyltransferase family 2 protein [Haloterrigena salifodinae]
MSEQASGSDGSPSPSVYCIVLNWNGYEDTASCLRSLSVCEYSALEIIVVDNGSDDDSGYRLEDEFPDVTVLYNEENRGFAGGMNTGIEFAVEAGADYVWILNNDTIVPNDSKDIVARLVSPLENQRDVGMTSPLIRASGTDQIWFWGAKVNPRSLNPKHVTPPDGWEREIQHETGHIPLCAAMVDVTMLDNIGRINEEYFLYFEDVDFSLRARGHGYRLITVTDIEIEHGVSSSTGDNLSPLSSYYAARNRLLLYRVAGNDGTIFEFVLGYIVWITLLTGERAVNFHASGLMALYRGAIDGILGQTGRGPYP